MEEKNPLQISPTHATPIIKNPRGRRSKTQSILFSSKPRSIVSQILKKMIIENKVILPIEHSANGNEIESMPIVVVEDETDLNNGLTLMEDADQSEDYCSPKPKPKSFKSSSREKPKLYSCDFTNCLYSTKLSCNLQKHKRTHTGEKPFLCDRCSFRTNFSNSLNAHRRLHTTERPYQCAHCNYRCNSISNLKKHSHTKHRTLTTNEDTEILKYAK